MNHRKATLFKSTICRLSLVIFVTLAGVLPTGCSSVGGTSTDPTSVLGTEQDSTNTATDDGSGGATSSEIWEPTTGTTEGGGSASEAANSDTGTPTSDTGTPTSDTGTPTSDTGTPTSDTGTPTSDTGTPTSDTGTPTSDTGTPTSDTGTPTSDTGTPTSDTGTPTSDTGTPTSDTGTADADTTYFDEDSDESLAFQDCNDHDSEISPLRPEVAGNGKDDDCDSETDELIDTDTDTDTAPQYPGSVDTVFGIGSLIIPMDLDYQDIGVLQAYGLVYQLLMNNINVYWLIKTPKFVGEHDFTASAKNVATGADVTDHGYRGGPFAVAAVDAARALVVVDTWQTSHVTIVHQVTKVFTGPVARILRQTPRIGILANGQEVISFGYMKAAGIPDSLGQQWPTQKDATGVYAGYPDILSVAEVRGPTDTNDKDGALFDANGEPAFCELMTMHWDVADRDEDAIAEIREYLNYPVHFFAECQSVNAVENADNGRFLTPNGFVIDEQPAAVDMIHPYLPFSQMDGAFKTVGGSEPSYSLPAGDSYFDDGVVMIKEAGTPIGSGDVWMTGYLDGACKIDDIVVRNTRGTMARNNGITCPGKISYLGGHKYSIKTPMSANPDAQGTRLFLNALFEADCITEDP